MATKQQFTQSSFPDFRRGMDLLNRSEAVLQELLPFVAQQVQKEIDQISVIDVSADVVRLFLRHLEESRKCAVATRNQRSAAIHSLARFVGLHGPEYIEWCGQSLALCVHNRELFGVTNRAATT